jgi:hypothetical protein
MTITLALGAVALFLFAYGIGYDHGRAAERAMRAATEWDDLVARPRRRHRQRQHARN